MLVLICGCRRWANYRCKTCNTSVWPCVNCAVTNKRMRDAIRLELFAHNLKPGIDTIIHGGAKGADSIAGETAQALGFKVVEFPANWSQYGKGAGPKRNQEMLNQKPDLVLAFHPDLSRSKGTKHMVEIARKAGVPVEVFDK